MFRRHVSYANVVATMALVFAMGGTAIAAKHYLISSTKQIKPSVLRSLRGSAGPKGATGLQGAPGKEGAAGKEGKEGKAGPLLTTLPSGQTLRGAFGGGGHASATREAIQVSLSYPFPLATDPTPVVIGPGEKSTTQCPGSSGAPEAAKGYLCVYVAGGINVGGFQIYGDDGSADYRFGGVVYTEPPSAGLSEFWGTWAVTAP